MKITSASFLVSNTDYKSCPVADRPEYAFIGRSNVGKSSLINRLTRQKNLAKTSQQPGKTQLINHFLIDENWYLVDLPGYGWAKVSQSERAKWNTMIRQYLMNRENLYCVFLLIDIRIPPQKIDLEFMQWLAEAGVPFALIFTKADKLGKTKLQAQVDQYLKTLKATWEELPLHFVSSSEDGRGCDEILTLIDQLNTEGQNEVPSE